jgi:hypothetical protein
MPGCTDIDRFGSGKKLVAMSHSTRLQVAIQEGIAVKASLSGLCAAHARDATGFDLFYTDLFYTLMGTLARSVTRPGLG